MEHSVDAAREGRHCAATLRSKECRAGRCEESARLSRVKGRGATNLVGKECAELTGPTHRVSDETSRLQMRKGEGGEKGKRERFGGTG